MKLYNTLSRSKEELPSPEIQKILTMYACGPTVYDETHIGHMRKFTMDDILKKTLEYLGHEVKHVMNITDVGHLTGDDDSGEDKLEKGAKNKNMTVWDVAKAYEDKFWETMESLNIEKEKIKILHATKSIPAMIDLIKKIESNGYTYQTSEALYFDVSKFKNYGKLSGQKLEDKMQGVRDDVKVDSEKKHPADFALWFKRVGRFVGHTMHWESPWEDGFPGWHIECSAMSMQGLQTETIDIHTGGVDHIPVHHENEIAQSESATGKQFVKWWVHHAFLNVDGEKMSKSKGNFYTLADIKKRDFNPLAVRYLFLQTHYRKPMNFTWEAVESAQTNLKKIFSSVISFRKPSNVKKNPKLLREYLDTFKSAIENDLNTAEALSVLWNVLKSELSSNEKLELLYKFDEVFGFHFTNLSDDMFDEKYPDSIRKLADDRKEARECNNFKKADELRKIIEEKGYIVEDTEKGYVLHKK